MVSHKLIRYLLIAAGTLSVGLAVLGIFLPVMPTTPFLLLAAACYAKSSEKFYKWLISHKWFGSYIKQYREGQGIPLRAKVLGITMNWTMVLISVIFVAKIFLLKFFLILSAVGVTIFMLRMPTLRKPVPEVSAAS
ncbi:MAG: DUF454 domain-containing protein [Chlorobiales bacterium]|nr:DUF454 domain-containing protein [Chlorobiales bacterium]